MTTQLDDPNMRTCFCCEQRRVVVGHTPYCQDCYDAIQRFVSMRRLNARIARGDKVSLMHVRLIDTPGFTLDDVKP